MHHLNHKDYLFLIFVALLMFFVIIVFWFNWSGVNPNISQIGSPDNSAQVGQVVDMSHIFNCGEKFYLNQPVANFEYSNFDNSEPGILKECFWTTKVNRYVIVYMQGAQTTGVPDFPEEIVDLSYEIKKFDNAYEVALYDQGKKLYTLTRAFSVEDKIIILGMNFDIKTTLDNPEFRSFVDSFKWVK